MRMLADQGLFDTVSGMNLDQVAMKKYLRAVEIEYKINPYHNRLHALDVMQTCHAVLMQSPAFQAVLTPVERLALLIGAYVHDVGHPGVDNKLLERLSYEPNNDIRPDLADFALMYNNKAILESFHISHAFHIAFSPNHRGGNPFATFSKEDFTHLRKMMIELVLITDMSQHFAFLTKLKGAVQSCNFGKEPMDLKHGEKAGENRLLIMKAVLHACDVSNVAKPKETALKWTKVVNQEFWAQGDLEAEIKVSTGNQMLVRQNVETPEGRTIVAKGQMSFMKFIVKPLFDEVATQLPFFREVCVPQINANMAYWEEVQQANQPKQ